MPLERRAPIRRDFPPGLWERPANELILAMREGSWMTRLQMLVLAAGTVLLAHVILFPRTQYPIQEWSEDGLQLRVTVHRGYVPIWKAWPEHENAALKGNPFNDTIILWPLVWVPAAGIVLVCAVAFRFLGWRQAKRVAE